YVILTNNRVGFRLGRYDKGKQLVIDPILRYATYLGGTGSEHFFAIATDNAANVYVSGETNSSDYPVLNAAQSVNKGDYDIIVSKLSPSGKLIYSTYIG